MLIVTKLTSIVVDMQNANIYGTQFDRLVSFSLYLKHIFKIDYNNC